jgi:hypothetical protein
LAEIPYDLGIAEAYSRGQIIAEVSPHLQALFTDLLSQIRALARPGLNREVAHA